MSFLGAELALPAAPPKECGIPKHFGLFYAMGTALMMEGLLSACYHVCPNYTNFQFGECCGGWGVGRAEATCSRPPEDPVQLGGGCHVWWTSRAGLSCM